MWAVSVIFLNGVKTVTIFDTQAKAAAYANAMAEWKGCRVFMGQEVIAQSSPSGSEDDND